MSDDQSPEQESVENDPAGMRKVLKQLGEENGQLKERLAQVERNEAFMKAGIPEGEDGTVWALFRNSYQGELSPDAISEAKAKLGLPEPAPTPEPEPAPMQSTPPEEPQSQVDPSEAAAMADMANVRAQFSTPADSEDPLIKEMLAASGPQELERIAAAHGFLAETD